MKWLGYIVLIIIQIFGLTTILQSVIGIILRFIKNPTISAFLSGLIMWIALDFVWLQIFSSRIPILLLGLSFATQYLRANVLQKNMINENAKYLIAGEGFAIIAYAIYEVIFTTNYTWV